MATTDPGAAPNEYTLGRLIRTYLWALVAGAIMTVVLLAVLFALAFWAFALSPGPRATQIQPVVDELALAPGWEIARTEVRETGTLDGCWRLMSWSCPQVMRYYLVDGDFPVAVAAAHAMVEDAGAFVDWESDPDCGTSASSSRVCYLYGNVGDVRLAVNVYLPGEGDDGRGIARTDRVLVRLIANIEPSRATPRPGASP